MLKKLFLDLNNFKANLGSVERGDSIELNIKLLDSEDYSRSKFRVLGAKADGKYVEQIECINLEEKDLKIVLEDQFVNCEGIVKLELNVVSGETEITTKEFYFFVSNTMNAEIIDSADSIPTLEKVSKYVDDAVNNLDALKEASADITIINSEFKENEIKRKANELLRERSEKERVRLESIRTTEEADRIKAEAERKEAENNRKVAESNRKLAENTRKTNEAARVRAELNRQSLFEENEEIRNENENLRIEAEKERKLTFSNNNKFESERVEAEKLRCIAEDKRVTAEKTRVKAEEERIKAETRRENTYTDFNDSEVERKNNEANRVRAEAERVNAESGRNELFNTNEEKRNSTFIESERTRERAFNEAQSNRNEAFEESERVREEAFKVSEAARDEAEEERVAAELLRVEAEKLRVAGEENRNTTFTQSEEERKTTFEEAENTRKVAESKRVKAESSRGETEKLRVTAETGRVEAESLRVTAEEERVAAETKREEGFNKFEGRISANTEELKNARTATTGEKFDTLDERIDCEVDRLNKKIDVTMLQQEDKGSHLVENTVEGMTTDMVIKGRTLQNLFNQEGYYINPNGTQQYFHSRKYKNLFKAGKYTLKNITGNALIWDISRKDNDEWVKSIKSNKSIVIELEEGQYVRNIQALTINGWILNESTRKILEHNVVILEGDRLDIIDSINYFEGIKSFGEAEKEGNKISILSHGKNLLNIDEKLSFTGGDRLYLPIMLNSNRDYCISSNSETPFQYRVMLCSSSDLENGKPKEIKQLNPSGVANRQLKFNSGNYSGDYIILFHSTGMGVNYSKYDLMLEEGTQATPCEPYKQDKKDILLQNLGFDEGLRGINDISDELNSLRNVAIKRIGKREYREGDELLENIITDKTNTYYVLEEPIETPLDENINLKTFGEKTYVSFENTINGTSSFKAPVNTVATISRLNRENRALEEENRSLRQDFESTTLSLTDSDLELVKQNVDIDFRLMEVEFALDIPQSTLCSNINFKNKKGEVKNMARTPYAMMKIVILSGDYDREDYIHKVGKYYERGRMTKEEYDELMSLMTADEVISK
ncbi:phage pre-neck appendage-like protein [Clostridium perfringens]|uniref:hypothetical protein n=1 Tax=Clostridium perfringens TaxID=1502 RepID=UPI000D97ADF2|nr:hypothetical protein [Clostridium perfringens]SQB24262.1 phage pre-neck appendage-like protein [Clostridium perfringens]